MPPWTLDAPSPVPKCADEERLSWRTLRTRGRDSPLAQATVCQCHPNGSAVWRARRGDALAAAQGPVMHSGLSSEIGVGVRIRSAML
jgi:hypothetical protein